MDYQKFYADVVSWINQSNQLAIRHGLDSNEFWDWVMRSTGEVCNKYDNNDLVKKQMTMLFHWLEDVYEGRR